MTHYIDKYGFVPPFVLVKILTFGVVSSYYGLLKQSDRQAIAKYFKISGWLYEKFIHREFSTYNMGIQVPYCV